MCSGGDHGPRTTKGPFVVVDELINDQKVAEFAEWRKNHPDVKVLIIGTKPTAFGGIKIVWDPFDYELRSKVEGLLGHEIRSDLLDPENRDELEKHVE